MSLCHSLGHQIYVGQKPPAKNFFPANEIMVFFLEIAVRTINSCPDDKTEFLKNKTWCWCKPTCHCLGHRLFPDYLIISPHESLTLYWASSKETDGHLWIFCSPWIFSSEFWSSPRQTDRQTDRRTDGRTDGQKATPKTTVSPFHDLFQAGEWAYTMHQNDWCYSETTL